MRRELRVFGLAATAMFCGLGCAEERAAETPASPTAPHPSILLVTLDTTRADSIGPEAEGVETPTFDGLVAQGLQFTQAYATTPQTLPSHSSMMTGLYPAGHGVHENARVLGSRHPVLAERLRDAGYRTAAFVSAFPLDRRFGLARGFEVYDDELAEGTNERSSEATTDRAIRFLESSDRDSIFLWVHYFDPHHPYAPPPPFDEEYRENPYLGEIAAMDRQMGRLVEAFDSRAEDRPTAILVAGDHGEGLGEHGEEQHGHLLYQGTMHVPLVLRGPGVEAGATDAPVSVRRIFHTVLDWAGVGSSDSLLDSASEVVLGEAMTPFLQYGWQPQVMGISGAVKAIHAGETEIYDLSKDPGETDDLAGEVSLGRELRRALRDYPVPSTTPGDTGTLDDEARLRLAALGYVASESVAVAREDAPRPRDMTHLFDDLDRASGLFVAGEYEKAIPLLERILDADPGNLSAALRIAVAHSVVGQEGAALKAFERARELAPDSSDVDHYLGLHHARHGNLEEAELLLERSLADSPDRLAAVETLAVIRERQGRLPEALDLRRRVLSLKDPTDDELVHVGELAMAVGNTPAALEVFEDARQRQRNDFAHHLELGVLFLDAGRLEEAGEALDEVPPNHPGYPMALFKRAQVAVLLGEPDAARKIQKARDHADEVTRELIERERLFE